MSFDIDIISYLINTGELVLSGASPQSWILYPQLLDHIYISNCWILYLTVFLNLVLSSGLTDQMNCTTDHVLSCTVNGYNNTRVRDRSAY